MVASKEEWGFFQRLLLILNRMRSRVGAGLKVEEGFLGSEGVHNDKRRNDGDRKIMREPIHIQEFRR